MAGNSARDLLDLALLSLGPLTAAYLALEVGDTNIQWCGRSANAHLWQPAGVELPPLQLPPVQADVLLLFNFDEFSSVYMVCIRGS